MKFAVIASFGDYNQRRYSKPWVCKMTQDGSFDFDEKVGEYTGKSWEGEGGDLVVFDPAVDQVYGYGQKDHRGNGTLKAFKKWNGEAFVKCDRIGREVAE